MSMSQHILNKPDPDVPWYSSWSPSVTFAPESSVNWARANTWTAAFEGWWPHDLVKSLNSWNCREKFRIQNNFLLLTCILIFIHACAAAANMLTEIKQFSGWILRQCFTFGRDIIKQICWKLDDWACNRVGPVQKYSVLCSYEWYKLDLANLCNYTNFARFAHEISRFNFMNTTCSRVCIHEKKCCKAASFIH